MRPGAPIRDWLGRLEGHLRRRAWWSGAFAAAAALAAALAALDQPQGTLRAYLGLAAYVFAALACLSLVLPASAPERIAGAAREFWSSRLNRAVVLLSAAIVAGTCIAVWQENQVRQSRSASLDRYEVPHGRLLWRAPFDGLPGQFDVIRTDVVRGKVSYEEGLTSFELGNRDAVFDGRFAIGKSIASYVAQFDLQILSGSGDTEILILLAERPGVGLYARVRERTQEIDLVYVDDIGSVKAAQAYLAASYGVDTTEKRQFKIGVFVDSSFYGLIPFDGPVLARAGDGEIPPGPRGAVANAGPPEFGQTIPRLIVRGGPSHVMMRSAAFWDMPDRSLLFR